MPVHQKKVFAAGKKAWSQDPDLNEALDRID